MYEADPKPQSQPTPGTAPSAGSDKNVGMAIVAYFLFFLPLLTESKNDPYVKFHVKQSLLLFLGFVSCMVISWVPFIGWIVATIIPIGLFVLWIIGLIGAITGEQKPLPLIGKYAEEWFKF